MLDHVFVDAIGALRDALEGALLERRTPTERYQVDVLLGDTTWETSYVLPGERTPPRVQADITLDWSAWSQSAYRSWLAGEEPDDDPRIDITIVFRIQRLVEPPDLAAIVADLPSESARLGPDPLRRGAPTAEAVYADDLRPLWHAVELPFDGGYDLDETALRDGSTLDAHFAATGAWIASMLVRLGDLPLRYHPTR